MSAVVVSPALFEHPGYIAGRYYGRSMGTASATILATENRLYFFPVFFPKPVLVDRVSSSVTTGAGDAQYQVRMGVYQNAAGRPSALLVDGGLVSIGTGTGACEVTVSTAISGWVWLCLIGNRNAGATGTQATFRGYASETRENNSDLLGNTTTDAFITGQLTAFYHDQTVGSWGAYVLPTTAPTLTLAATVMPGMTVRVA